MQASKVYEKENLRNYSTKCTFPLIDTSKENEPKKYEIKKNKQKKYGRTTTTTMKRIIASLLHILGKTGLILLVGLNIRRVDAESKSPLGSVELVHVFKKLIFKLSIACSAWTRPLPRPPPSPTPTPSAGRRSNSFIVNLLLYGWFITKGFVC